jgi:hypothetical protein
VRYADSHPSITVHFDLDTYGKVMSLRERSGVTANQLVRQALGSVERHVDAIQAQGREANLEEGRKAGYLEGYKVGYAKAVAMYRLTYPCAVCGQPIALRVGDKDAVEVADHLTEEGWAHSTCLKPSA